MNSTKSMFPEEPLAQEEQPKSGKAKGGKARASRLSPEQRSAIARKASAARWNNTLAEAVCGSADTPLRIGDVEIECYVLQDGTRVITQASMLQAIGRHRKANVRAEGGAVRTPAILQGKAISRFITDDIRQLGQPIIFRPPVGGRANGYRAELLPALCEVYLRARDAGDLPKSQYHVAVQAEILIRGLAQVGIIALVDEATGYQEVRANDALARILEAFIAKELQAYVRTFPVDFYRELFRLRGLDYPNSPVQKPQYFGHLTNDIVYRRLAPGVLDELKKVTERGETGRAKHKLFQRLTTNIGYPKLREHLGSVVMLMKLSDDWSDFTTKLDRFHPRFGSTLQLPFGEDDNGRGL